MFDGFFGAYALFGLSFLLGLITFDILFSWLSVKAFKSRWGISIIQLIISAFLYFIDLKEVSIIFFGLFIIISIILILKKNKK